MKVKIFIRIFQKIKKLKWKPKTTLKDGLNKTLEYYKKNMIKFKKY